MKKTGPSLFLSYSRSDSTIATALEVALKERKLNVWRDARSITAGDRWFAAIEGAIRESRGVVVLITPASCKSDWVTYEYALAIGARVPVVAVCTLNANPPKPIEPFQIVPYQDAKSAAERIDDGIETQSRAAAREDASLPILVARFQERNGSLVYASDGKTPSICMDLWIEQAPARTKAVTFEILDLGFRDEKWTKRRQTHAPAREFLTDDMDSYGDVWISARGVGVGVSNWSIKSRLHEALLRYYSGTPISREIRSALRQIRDN